MLSLSLEAILRLSKTTSPKKIFPTDCITPYKIDNATFRCTPNECQNIIETEEIKSGCLFLQLWRL